LTRRWLICAEKANWLREEFLTGTAIAVVIALLILLVSPKNIVLGLIGTIFLMANILVVANWLAEKGLPLARQSVSFDGVRYVIRG